MVKRFSSLRRPPVLVALLLFFGLLAWGGHLAYCHIHDKMSDSASATAPPSEARVPVVTVVEPVHMPAVRSLALAASVEAFEKATLYAKVAGYLKWIKVDKGDPVQKDEVLALIEVPEMEKEYQNVQAAVRVAQAAQERAQADVALKELTYKRLSAVRQSQPNVISQQEVDVARAGYEVTQGDVKLAQAKLEAARSEVEKLQALMEYAKIRAPFDGVVTERFVDPGALIQVGTSSKGNPIVTVANVDKVRVYFYVPEREVPYLKRGDPAQVVLDALPGKAFDGQITRFASALDPDTRTMKTETDLRNPRGLIRPGMYGTVKLEMGAEANALFVPAQSVHQSAEGGAFLYTVAQGRIQKIAVETGLDDGKMVQVKGLRGDETIVLSSTTTLQEGLTVRTAKAGS